MTKIKVNVYNARDYKGSITLKTKQLAHKGMETLALNPFARICKNQDHNHYLATGYTCMKEVK